MCVHYVICVTIFSFFLHFCCACVFLPLSFSKFILISLWLAFHHLKYLYFQEVCLYCSNNPKQVPDPSYNSARKGVCVGLKADSCYCDVFCKYAIATVCEYAPVLGYMPLHLLAQHYGRQEIFSEWQVTNLLLGLRNSLKIVKGLAYYFVFSAITSGNSLRFPL